LIMIVVYVVNQHHGSKFSTKVQEKYIFLNYEHA